jgi:hypothetical protein
MPIPLILSSNILLLSYRRLPISYSCPRITTYKSVLAMLVSPPNPKVVAANISVIVAAFSSILLTYCSPLL